MNFLPEGVGSNKDITYLAKTNFRGQHQTFGIKRRDRRQHMYVLGKSGTGKSALLANMIVQNIWNGEGVAVVDPHGELVESILATIPPHRVKDVIYFNPADHDFHIGFNVLQIDDTRYKHLVASGLMGIFTKIWANAWSARMEYILNNAILALLDTPGSTLLGIPRLLVDKDYRQTIVNNLKDPVIKAFWVHEYETWRDQYRNEAIAPIQNKVGQFLSTSIVRNVVGQAKSTIDLFEAMNSGKIFLVNVSKGRIGEDNSALLGGMLITKLQLAAMERVRIPEDERRDFFLYVDEFQNFVTDSFASILSEARKYRLNLTLAHQYIAQLVTKESESVRDAVFGNVGTMIVFRVGAADADFLEKDFEPEFRIEDMVNLPNYNAYLKLMVDGVTSRPFSALTLPPFKVVADSNVAEQIIESSRRLYTRPKEEVEKEINQWSGIISNTNEAEGKFKAICSSCAKETTVPFAPEPGRPVYCKDCIAKIKSGEIKPMKGTRGKDLTPQSFSALANLGIEFAPSASSSPSHAPSAHAPVSHAPSSVPHVPHKTPVAPTFTPRPSSTPAPIRSPLSPLKRPAEKTGSTTPAPRPATPVSSSVFTARKPVGEPVALPSQAHAIAHASSASVATVPHPAPVAIAEKPEKKPFESEALKDILKQALGEAIQKGEEFQKKKDAELPRPVPAPAPVKEEKKTVSLASLRKPDASKTSSTTQFGVKAASDGKLSALQEAIARAQSPNVRQQPVAASTVVSASAPAQESANNQSVVFMSPKVEIVNNITHHTVTNTIVTPAPIAEKPAEVPVVAQASVEVPHAAVPETPAPAGIEPILIKEDPVPAAQPDVEKTAQEKPASAETSAPVKATAAEPEPQRDDTAVHQKMIREVPEDILRSVLE